VSELARTVERLSEASRRSPHTELVWPDALDREQWSFSPELISLYGTEAYARLTEPERKRLSFFEAVNFFSLNIHGEKFLVEGLARRLYRRGTETISPYLHHFLDEENKHMAYFGGFCTRYAGKVYPDRKLAFPREYAEGEEEFLFFAKVLIFEEIVDAYNVRMARDARLVPVVRQINQRHHDDETRHLAFGRRMVRDLHERYRPRWSRETREGLREAVAAYVLATWKEYHNPDVYRDAGLADPFTLHLESFRAPSSGERRKELSPKCLHFVLDGGMTP
jgi:hypothetical protein